MTGFRSISFSEASKQLLPKLVDGKEYVYGDIKKILLELFPTINANQVAGLMSRFTKEPTAIFDTKKEPGSRSIYTLKNRNINETTSFQVSASVKELIITDIQKVILSIGSIPSKAIKDSSDLDRIRTSEMKLQEIIKML